MRRVRDVLVASMSLVLFLPIGAAGADTAGGANNVVMVSTTAGSGTATRARLQVAGDPGPTVANQNLAVARSTDCTGCHTVAVAMQVVLVEGSPNDFEPANAASASNANCDSCTTFAYAYQYVLEPGRPVYLSSGAQQTLATLRGEADSLAASDLSYLDLKAQLDSLFDQFVQTVSEDLRAAGTGGAGAVYESSQQA